MSWNNRAQAARSSVPHGDRELLLDDPASELVGVRQEKLRHHVEQKERVDAANEPPHRVPGFDL